MDLPDVDSSLTPAALQRLVGFRFAVAALVLVSVVGIRLFFDVPVRWAPVGVAFVALLAVNGMLQWRIVRRQSVSERELFVNFGLEVLALTALLVFVGGSTSPLVSLYLLPLTMAANLLARRHTWALAAMTAVCYSFLFAAGDVAGVHEHGAMAMAKQRRSANTSSECGSCSSSAPPSSRTTFRPLRKPCANAIASLRGRARRRCATSASWRWGPSAPARPTSSGRRFRRSACWPRTWRSATRSCRNSHPMSRCCKARSPVAREYSMR